MTTDVLSGMMPDIAEWTYSVQIWPDDVDGGYVAECIDLPGCMSQGETEQEALDNIRDAIEELLASLLRDCQEAARQGAALDEPVRPGNRHEVTVALHA
jgi:predicted RNase H-like HicB family nuclease